ncbi:bifunctional tRNA (5-methylaminomethyl-2-thiouridine)(34)-methyltransferase MnmD/FAD-dependent 5-carboxymethylaminomethyl-2-thiouridine(34) oxidoreductase MnmC [Pseudomonadota bacterium]
MSRFIPITPAQLDWNNNAPQCRQHNDIYFSREGGIEETDYVFIQGNQLPQRWKNSDAFTIAETGFGTGLNFLCTLAEWQKRARPNARLHFISVEKHPLQPEDLKRALSALPSLKGLAEVLINNYPPAVHGLHRMNFLNGKASLTLLMGDAGDMFADLNAKIDAWYLDGFAPSKNPDMWSEKLFKNIARLSKPETTFATFTAAGIVKRGLKAVGFDVKTQKGFGRKRDMLIGNYVGHENKQNSQPWFHYSSYKAANKKAVVIGGGLAGCSTSHALAKRDWHITLIERHADAAQGASGNHSGVVMPRLTADMSPAGRFYLSAFLHTTHWLDQLKEIAPELSWHKSGVLQLSNQKQINQLRALQLPRNILDFLGATDASENSGAQLKQEALHFSGAGWVQPPDLCRWLLKNKNISSLFNQHALSIKKENGLWQIWSQDKCIAEAEAVIIANGYDAERLIQANILKLQKVRGQITYLPTTSESKKLKMPVCYDGYVIPAYKGLHCAGATYDINNNSSQIAGTDNEEILDHLKTALPEFDALTPSNGRAAFRTSTQDHLPIIGPVPDIDFYQQHYADLHHGKAARLYENAKYHDGLFISTGHGSRGLVSCPLAAEVIAATLNDEPIPLSLDLLDAVHPGRFMIRKLKRPQKQKSTI